MSANQKAPPKIGADVVVQTLEDQGVKYAFGIPGAKIDAVFNALVDSSIQTVVCRHEQNAAFIAGGIGRMTGKAGICIGTSGPGVSNLTTGLATATSEGDPVVALGGAVATSEALKQIHQTMDAVALLRPVTKFSASIGAPHAVSEVILNAFRAAETGRPGAAFVNLPKDIMTAPAQANLLTLPRFSGPGLASKEAIKEAAKIITAAKSPVVLLGLLASRPNHAQAVRTFIKHNNLPVVGTFQSAGAISATLFDHFGGRVGQLANQPADHLLETADLVITIGYDPVEYDPSIWNKDNTRQVIHIDALRADIDSCYTPNVELEGDIGHTLHELTSLTKRTDSSPIASNILKSIAETRDYLASEAAKLNGSPVHPMRIVNELQKLISTDMTICLDMGSFHLWIARHLYSFRARQILISNGQQTLGVALPWAIAATLVRPNEKVISISGDGGFLFSSMELETAVRLKCNFVHMIWIDGAYDMVRAQEVLKYGRGSGVDFGPVDPVKYAEAFGATGLMIRSADEIGPVMKKALETQGPVIVGIHVDDSDNHKLFQLVDENAFH